MVSCRFGRWFLRQTKKSRGFSEEYPSRVRLIEGYTKIKNYQNSQTLMWLFLPQISWQPLKNLERLVLEGGTKHFFRSTCGERRSNCVLLPFVLAQRTKDNLRFWQWTLWHGCSLAFLEHFRSSWLQSCSQVVNYRDPFLNSAISCSTQLERSTTEILYSL